MTEASYIELHPLKAIILRIICIQFTFQTLYKYIFFITYDVNSHIFQPDLAIDSCFEFLNPVNFQTHEKFQSHLNIKQNFYFFVTTKLHDK